MADETPTEQPPLPYTDEEVEQARVAHEAKSPEDLAFDAGRAAANDPDARKHGVAACPFSPLDHSEDREAWLSGFAAALDEEFDPRAMLAEIKAAKKDA